MTHVLESLVTETLSDDVAVKIQTLEDLADQTFTRVAKFFAETMDDPGFCGIAVDQKVTDDGRIASLMLIPVDDVGGTPTRRVAR